MAIQRPLIVANGRRTILPSGDSVLGASPFHEICHIAGMQPTLYLDFARQDFRHYSPATGLREKALSDIVTFTRESNATYFDAKGVMQTAGSNVPRLDFDPVTGGCKGLLIEESRTNLFLNSLHDGTNLSTQTVTVIAAAHTISFYGSGSITLSGVHSATITGTADTTRTALTFTPTAGSLTCTVSGTVKFAQCGLGGFATSFIPTTTATVTRAADQVVIDGTAFSDFYRQDEGTVLLCVTPIGKSNQYGYFLSFDDGSTDNVIALGWRFDSSYREYSSGGVATNLTGRVIAGSILSSATSFSSAGFVSYFDGDPLSVDNSLLMPAVDRLYFGSIGGLSSVAASLKIHKCVYFPKRLTNAQLQQLSALTV